VLVQHFFSPFSRLPSCYSSSTTTICLFLCPYYPPQVPFVGGSAHDCTGALFTHLKTCATDLCRWQCCLGVLATTCGQPPYSSSSFIFYYKFYKQSSRNVWMCAFVSTNIDNDDLAPDTKLLPPSNPWPDSKLTLNSSTTTVMSTLSLYMCISLFSMISNICATFGSIIQLGHYCRMCFEPLAIYTMSFRPFPMILWNF